MSIICQLYVNYMSIICQLYVNYMSIICQLYVLLYVLLNHCNLYRALNTNYSDFYIIEEVNAVLTSSYVYVTL
jgi:hypothetical protein